MILHFAGGGDLFSQLEKRRRLPEEAVRFYAAEILLALEVLHRSRVCYRDLKPENVLLTIDGHILLTDMGMSKYVYVCCMSRCRRSWSFMLVSCYLNYCCMNLACSSCILYQFYSILLQTPADCLFFVFPLLPSLRPAPLSPHRSCADTCSGR